MTMALALLPETQIEEGFRYIVTYVQANGLEPILNQYMAYVRRTWIQGVGGQHLSVFGQPRRTNNDQESFHNQLLQRFSHVHQNVWRFLEELRNIEHAYVQQYATYENGVANDAVPAPSYLSNNRRIQDATSLLLARRYNAGEFLRRVSNVVPTPRNNNLTVEDAEEEVAAPPNEGLPPLPVALPPGMRQIENMHEMPTDNEDEDDLHIIVQAPVRRGGRGRGRGGGRGRVQEELDNPDDPGIPPEEPIPQMRGRGRGEGRGHARGVRRGRGRVCGKTSQGSRSAHTGTTRCSSGTGRVSRSSGTGRVSRSSGTGRVGCSSGTGRVSRSSRNRKTTWK
ncbi:uncharacterized protein LOC128993492 [Macrosteles quadrilineatus]|uniref:uncharacterized protein LOC128993492 n=1 Tax=Macrosteles quadrilineatus TaxID=74068 RepID=UPI0023E33CF1|nr:uncharacterized protein LOC128993492 [Macrosteles quadrilineatus]